MGEKLILRRPRPRGASRPRRRALGAAFSSPPGSPAFAYPGIPDHEERSRRTLVSGSLATLLHLGGLGLLALLASVAPVVESELIPVRILREPPPRTEEPAPAPKALAERRFPHFSPQVQSVKPQVINPRVIAAASPVVSAETLELEAVGGVRAPTRIDHRSIAVEHVAQVNSIATARAATVDVPSATAPAARGPVRVDAPVGPSVGPRQVVVATATPSMGTALEIGGDGSSVREGIASDRDVIGSPDGQVLVNVDTAVGEGFLRGSGGSGSGIRPATAADPECVQRAEVQAYLQQVHDQMYQRWRTPPGVPDSEVVLRFRVDVAGSAQSVELLRSADNALGASALDAMHAASPFPPMPEGARCLAGKKLIGKFRTFSAGAG